MQAGLTFYVDLLLRIRITILTKTMSIYITYFRDIIPYIHAYGRRWMWLLLGWNIPIHGLILSHMTHIGSKQEVGFKIEFHYFLI